MPWARILPLGLAGLVKKVVLMTCRYQPGSWFHASPLIQVRAGESNERISYLTAAHRSYAPASRRETSPPRLFLASSDRYKSHQTRTKSVMAGNDTPSHLGGRPVSNQLHRLYDKSEGQRHLSDHCMPNRCRTSTLPTKGLPHVTMHQLLR